jgi:hypothetical protein
MYRKSTFSFILAIKTLNKIEGTPILKLAMVKRYRSIKIFQKNLRKNVRQNNICHNIHQKIVKKIFVIKFVKKFVKKKSSKKFVKKFVRNIRQGHQSNNEFYIIDKSTIYACPISVLRSFARPASGRQA